MVEGTLGPRLITLDTSGILALLNHQDPDHQRARQVLFQEGKPYFVPLGIMGEAAYMVEVRLGPQALDSFLTAIIDGAYTLLCEPEDMGRVLTLVRKYQDLPLGYADAAVVACAGRHRGRVLTLNLRDFGIVSREGTIRPLPGWQ